MHACMLQAALAVAGDGDPPCTPMVEERKRKRTFRQKMIAFANNSEKLYIHMAK